MEALGSRMWVNYPGISTSDEDGIVASEQEIL